MKKLLILLVSFIVLFLSGCVNTSNKDFENLDNIPPVSALLEPEEEEDKKKTYILSNASSIRIRSGPGSNYSVIGSVQKNDMLSYQASVGNYYITIYKEQKAYIHKDYCSLVEFDVSNYKIEKAIDFGTQLLGYPYVWGSQRYHWGNGVLNINFKNGEFDCSEIGRAHV